MRLLQGWFFICLVTALLAGVAFHASAAAASPFGEKAGAQLFKAAAEGETAAEGEGEDGGEGETEGEGESPVTLIDQVALIAPLGNIAAPKQSTPTPVLFAAKVTLKEDAPGGLQPAVSFELDGETFPAEERNGVYFTFLELPMNATYRIRAKAEITASEETAFSVLRSCWIHPADDLDDNGYADDPFKALPVPGNAWQSVLAFGGCARATMMLALSPSLTTATAYLAMPNNNREMLTVRVPGGLVELGERAILILSMACDEASLFLPDGAGPDVNQRPGQIVDNGAFVYVGLILSTDGGKTFDEIGADRLKNRPMEMELAGLRPEPGFDMNLWACPASVNGDPERGVYVTPGPGNWNRDGFFDSQHPGAYEGSVAARLTKLSAFAPFQTGRPPRLEVTPAGDAGFYQFGLVRLNQAVTREFTLRNTGSTPITGAATLEDATGMFLLQQPADYVLEPDKSMVLRLQFVPVQSGHYEAVLTFTGGINGPVALQISGDGSPNAPKAATVLGCGGAGPGSSGGGWADGLLLVMVVLFLARAARTRRTA